MIEKFSSDELILANCKLAFENNALLKVALANQAAIMKHFGIDRKLTDSLTCEVIPGMKPRDPDHAYETQRDAAYAYSRVYEIQLWNYVFDIKRIREDLPKFGADLDALSKKKS